MDVTALLLCCEIFHLRCFLFTVMYHTRYIITTYIYFCYLLPSQWWIPSRWISWCSKNAETSSGFNYQYYQKLTFWFHRGSMFSKFTSFKNYFIIQINFLIHVGLVDVWNAPGNRLYIEEKARLRLVVLVILGWTFLDLAYWSLIRLERTVRPI